LPQLDFRPPTWKALICSTLTAKPHWSAAISTPGPDWTPSWRRRSSNKVSRFLYRNPDFNSYGVLNGREDFSSAHPDAVQSVVNSYEEARKWAKAHPDELAALLAAQAKVTQRAATTSTR
jgi:ABC-type nitrate/sulfonate/bicarbonate transport system substrate-binding protein